jgi:hypothetical protein
VSDVQIHDGWDVLGLLVLIGIAVALAWSVLR